MTRAALPLLLTCLAATSGCAAFRGYSPEVRSRPLPPSLRAHDRAPNSAVDISGDLTSDLPGDAPTRSTRATSLVEVIERAREDSFAVLAAAEEVEAASGRVQAATGALLPGAGVEIGGSYLHGRDINNAGEVLDGLDYPRYEPAVRIYYRVNLGAALARASGQRKDAHAAALSVEDARRTAMLQASIGYLDLALAYASVEIAKQLVDDSERFVTITEARATANIGTGAEVARAKADAARARQSLIRARGQWERASVQLAVLLRWPSGDFLVPSEREIRPEALFDTRAAAELATEAEHTRPDLRAIDARAQAAESQASAAWWDLLGPELDAGVRERLIGTELDDLAPTTLAHVFVSLSFSFEELGRLRTARAQARVAQIRQAALRAQVRGEIESARSTLRMARASIPEAQAAVAATTRSYESQLARFEAGTGLGIEIIEAQNARARAREELAAAILRYNAAQMELAASLGHLTPELVQRADRTDATREPVR